MPYRIDVPAGSAASLMRLLDLGALDIDVDDAGRGAALMPDDVTAESVARVLGVPSMRVSPAVGRDDGSVWRLTPGVVRVGRLRIVPARATRVTPGAGSPESGTTTRANATGANPIPGDLELRDSPTFGTGLHPTTSLCLELLGDLVDAEPIATMLDVGTGTGVLSLAGLSLGIASAIAVDIDGNAARAALENGRLNGVSRRLHVVHGDLSAVQGRWPLVMANVLAAPLIEMAPALAARLGHAGRLVLSGIRAALQADVERPYRHVGLHLIEARSRQGWVALVWRASW